MKPSRKFAVVIDILMVVILPILMSYNLVGKATHIYLGLTMVLLFIIHHIINRRWLKNMAKGRYTPLRGVSTLINLLLTGVMFAMPVSGLIMDGQIVPALHITGSAATARLVHLPVAYWGFVLLSLHLGFQWNRLHGSLKSVFNVTVPPAVSRFLRAAACLISLYGVRAFIKRDLWSYMSLTVQFAAFNKKEPLLYFFADYIAMMILFASIGFLAATFLQKAGAKRSTRPRP